MLVNEVENKIKHECYIYFYLVFFETETVTVKKKSIHIQNQTK